MRGKEENKRKELKGRREETERREGRKESRAQELV